MIPITMMIITVQEPFDIESFFGTDRLVRRFLLAPVTFINPLDSIPSVYPGTVKYSLKRILNGDKRR